MSEIASKKARQEKKGAGRAPGSKIPVTVLTGFLGSGKTTLLNHILNDETHGLRFAIIENEYGAIGVDEKILSEYAAEEVIEVVNGCICCTVRGDLCVALKNLYSRIELFDAIIVETTGLADPAPVAQTFFVDEFAKDHFVLDSIITVIDAKNIIERLDDEKPDGVENEAVEQVAFADRILLNKIDLIQGDGFEEAVKTIESRIRIHNSNAEIIRCEQSKVDPARLLNLQAFDLEKTLSMDPGFLDTDAEHEHDPRISSVSTKFEGFLNIDDLQDWISKIIETKGADLFRYKGVLSVAGMKKKFVFQGVGMLFSGGFSDFEWGEGEVRENRFVFIGRNLDRKMLIDGFLACQCSEKLRFKVGDKVLANVGYGDRDGYHTGKIIRLWEDGNPYRIELSDKKKSNVWGSADSDKFVKAAPGTVAQEVLAISPMNITTQSQETVEEDESAFDS